MERLNFNSTVPYSAVEAAIHLNRYAVVKAICSGKKVLDVACGEGYGSNLIRQWSAASVDGLDIDVTAIENAKRSFQTENVRFQVANVEQLPFPDKFFDLVVSFETIEHLDNPELFLQEIKRVVTDSGVVVISCPNDPYYFGNDEIGNPYHKRKYTFFDFKEMAEKHLGKDVEYHLAFAVDGFMNIPFAKSTYPEDKGSYSMLEIMNSDTYKNAIRVQQDRYINHWNANYYLGIWGAPMEFSDMNSVVFCRETFREIPNDFERLYKKLQDKLNYYHQLEDGYRKLFEVAGIPAASFSKGYPILKELVDENNNKRCIEIQRLEMMLELSNKEKMCLYENQERLSAYKTELQIIKSTKGYKLLNLLYRIRMRFRHLLKGK